MWSEKQYVNVEDVIDILSMFNESIKELDSELYYGGELSADSYVEGDGVRKFSSNSILLRGVSSTLEGYIEKLRYSPSVKSESRIVRGYSEDNENVVARRSEGSSD